MSIVAAAGISPIQRTLVYAGDVVLFFRPETQELQAIKAILQIFGEASGLRINYRKTTATLIRGGEVEERITSVLDCQLVNFPIRYLGLQLALRPLTKAEWQPMIDKTRQTGYWMKLPNGCRHLYGLAKKRLLEDSVWWPARTSANLSDSEGWASRT
ncbi:hypothetical protein ACQ4PT_048828 [Festuca glaucescens]